jgi:hypothetical protein
MTMLDKCGDQLRILTRLVAEATNNRFEPYVSAAKRSHRGW